MANQLAPIQRIIKHPALVSGLAILSAACWGSGTVMSRAALDSLPPLTLLLFQLSASVLFLLLVMMTQARSASWHIRDLCAGLPGFLEPGLAYVFGIVGLSLTTASRMSLISAIEPLFIAVLASIFLRERMTTRTVFLAVSAVIGVALVSISDLSVSDKGALSGDLLVLLGTLSAAIYVVATRLLLHHYEPLRLTFIQQAVGLFGVVVVWLGGALVQHPVAALPVISLPTLLFAMLSGIVQYALAFWLYLLALRRLRATVAAFYLTLIPLFGVVGAYIFLGEHLSLVQILGAVCILGTIMLLSVADRSEQEVIAR